MGRFVGVGSLITVFLVLFVLPQLLLLGDTFVRRTALPAQRRLPLTAASRAARWVLLAAAEIAAGQSKLDTAAGTLAAGLTLRQRAQRAQ